MTLIWIFTWISHSSSQDEMQSIEVCLGSSRNKFSRLLDDSNRRQTNEEESRCYFKDRLTKKQNTSPVVYWSRQLLLFFVAPLRSFYEATFRIN